jgi:hypothetical protein
MPFRWTKLDDLLIWLRTHPDYQYCFVNHEQALKNALLSNKVPIRAKEYRTEEHIITFLAEFARIDSQISNKSKISVRSNCIKLDGRIFDDAEADAGATERWLVQNAIDTGFVTPNTIPPSDKAIDDLKQYLSTRPDNPPQIKDEVLARLRAGDITELGNRYRKLSKRAFGRIFTEHAPEAWTKGGRRPGRQREIKSPR